jgi:hypothetical protein
MKLPERSTVRISPLPRSSWTAHEAITTETPYAPPTFRALGTFAPSLPLSCDSTVHVMSRYFGSEAADIDPPKPLVLDRTLIAIIHIGSRLTVAQPPMEVDCIVQIIPRITAIDCRCSR